MSLKNAVIPALLASGLTATPAVGADASSESIWDLKKQIEELDQKVRVLERKQELDQEASTEKAKSAAIVTAGVTSFAIRSADTNFVLRIRGGVQTDARFYEGGGSANDTFLI